VDVGAVVIDPDLLRMRILAACLVVEENHIGLHALGVEDARGQAQDRVHIRSFEQLAAHRFARATFEEHVVGQDHCRTATDLEHRLDVLQEIELLVARGRPEVGAVVGQVLLFLLTLGIRERRTALFPKRRIGEECSRSGRWRTQSAHRQAR
jgi:hypothetical protein